MALQFIFKKLERLLNIRIVWILAIFFLLFLCHLIISKPTVYADEFSSSGGDIAQCKMSFTTAVEINSLPQNDLNSLSYDTNLVKGERDNWIQNNKFTNTGTYQFPDASRYPYVASLVQVPPNSNIDLGVLISNFAGHDIHISQNSVFFLSRNNPSEGNASRLLQGNFGDLNVTWKAFGNNISRTGIGFNFGGYDVSNSDTNANGKIIKTLKTIQPLSIVSRVIKTEYEGINLILNVTNVIRNESTYDLSNIELQDFDPLNKNVVYDEKYEFLPNETKVISYKINLNSDYALNFTTQPLQIIDPNFHYESITKSGNGIDSYSSFINRNDSNTPNSYNNQSVLGDTSNYGDYLTIGLIPYSIFSNTQDIKISPDIKIIKTVSQSNDINSSILTFNINVNNNGARDDNVVISDVLDSNLKFISNVGGSFENGKMSWHISNISHMTAYNFSFQAEVGEVPDMTTIKNFANYTSSNLNINSNITQTLIHSLELTLNKQVDKKEAVVGDLLTYTIYYSNKGSGNGMVHLVDILPDTLKFISCNKCISNSNTITSDDYLNSYSNNQLTIIAKIDHLPTTGTKIINETTLSDTHGHNLTSQIETNITQLILPTLIQVTTIPLTSIPIAPKSEIQSINTLPATGKGVILQIAFGIGVLLFMSTLIIPRRVLVKILNPIYLLPFIIIIPHIVFAASNYKDDVSPFWNGIKTIIEILRYMAGGIAVLVVVLIGIQKIISLMVPSEHSSTSSKVISLVVGLCIVIFAPDIIKLVAAIFNVSIDLPL